MNTNNLYPIKFNTNGKLVKYLKPVRDKNRAHIHEYMVDSYTDISLSKLCDWVNDLNGDLNNAILTIESDYSGSSYVKITLKIELTQEELDANEEKFLQKLKQYEEWLALSKDARIDPELNAKLTRAKSLKTQENNLLRKLEKIRKQRYNL